MARFGQKVTITAGDKPPVYLSIFSKDGGQRLTSYTILGEIHGKTMDDLENKAKSAYPDDYHVQQTEEEWAATIGSDLRWNGSEYTEPPEPTPEEIADREAREEAYKAESALNELQTKATRAMLSGGAITTFAASYQSTLASVSDAAALKMGDYFPEWDGAGHEYAVGDRVVYDGTMYKVLQAHTSQSTWTPTDAPSLFAKVLTSTTGEPLPWEKPDSTNPYMTGDRVIFDGKIYESMQDNNVWSPADYPAGWKEVTE